LRGLLDAVSGLTLDRPLDADVRITGVTHDSHQVLPGDLYAAIPGQNRHGVEFADEARVSGAVALLTDASGRERGAATGLPVVVAANARAVLGPVASEIYGRPSERLLVVGVTGTNGKTTLAYLVEAGLRTGGHRTGLIGTVETRVGDAAMESVRTTPEATDLQALLAVMRDRGADAVAMEVSSHALALHRVDGTKFDVAVFTNLSQDHLDFHADIEDYFAAKARLFTADFAARAVIDIDDPYGARLVPLAEIPVTRVSPAGNREADWWVEDVVLSGEGSTFTVCSSSGAAVLAGVQLLGAFNVANAALAIVALVEAGVPLEKAVDGVRHCQGVPGRMNRVDVGQPFVALVDYAHTPDAVTTLLDSVRPLTTGRVIGVLGCGGDRDRGKRPLMGAALARGADIAVLTSDNPRSENPLDILTSMGAGARAVPEGQRAEIVVEPDRRAAIARAVDLARPGDVLVVAGKGHERVQEIGEQRFPFDDAEELRAAIGAAVGS
jgi:UDP-N-acetylmuramoyl-L-alanyl-D-glutamate--2,6-diaminopimelate ligase